MLCGLPENHAMVITCSGWLILAECESLNNTEKCIALKKTAEVCVDLLESAVA